MSYQPLGSSDLLQAVQEPLGHVLRERWRGQREEGVSGGGGGGGGRRGGGKGVGGGEEEEEEEEEEGEEEEK